MTTIIVNYSEWCAYSIPRQIYRFSRVRVALHKVQTRLIGGFGLLTGPLHV